MANKYMTLVAGRDTLVEALTASAGSGDAGKIVALDNSGKLDPSLMPVGAGPDVSTIIASEALSAGDYVNIYNNAGTPNCRKADASNDRPAHGFVLAGVSMSANATVFYEGPNSGRSGLTIGSRYYLSTTGNVSATPPVTPGSLISQFLGIAVTATTINTDIADAIVL